MVCKIPFTKRKPPGTAFGFPLPDGPGVVPFVRSVLSPRRHGIRIRTTTHPRRPGRNPVVLGLWARRPRAVQAENAPKTVVVVAVRGRVPVAIRRAAVDWIVVPAPPTQDAIVILLHWSKYRRNRSDTCGNFKFFALRLGKAQKAKFIRAKYKIDKQQIVIQSRRKTHRKPK